MNTLLFSNTPSVAVQDNRGLSVRELQYHRHPDTPEVTRERITRHQYNGRGALTQSADPRLGARLLSGTGVTPNLTRLTSLSGAVLMTVSCDAGTTTAALSDIAGRPVWLVSAEGGVCTLQYEDTTLPGRPLSVTEQAAGDVPRITERFVYAGSTAAEKALNLAGKAVRHYDSAGRVQTDSVSLSGIPLSVTDWAGDGEADWQALLGAAQYTSLTTPDATGAVLTTTDAMGNRQRVAYDVTGLLSGSWLTLRGGAEQVIIASLTYSAAGQKLREVHGNGVTTTITVSDRSNRGVLSTLTESPAAVDALFTAGGQQTQLLPGQMLEWTARGELLKVTPVVRDGGTDDSESYRYDGGSQRVLKVSTQKNIHPDAIKLRPKVVAVLANGMIRMNGAYKHGQ